MKLGKSRFNKMMNQSVQQKKVAERPIRFRRAKKPTHVAPPPKVDFKAELARLQVLLSR
jgi:hypothetical protein